jgi:hypothetical protein
VLNTADITPENLQTAPKRGILAWITARYTRRALWSLFLMCALPLHFWTLILAFRDISWLTERTNAWDAVSVVAYALLYAFVESLLVFAVMALLGYLVPGRWNPDHRVVLLTVMMWILSLWAILDQLYFLVGGWMPGWLIDFFVNSGHPARMFYGVLLAVVGLSAVVPALLVIRSERAYRAVRGAIDRLSVLMLFYLALDVIGLVIVIIRNI